VSVRTVLVCAVQVPLVHGGAEILVNELVAQLRARGYESELVSLPFKWYPKEEIFAHAAAWRCIDLTESNGRPIDCVIATKFPSYFVRHPNKAVWLVHQHRAAYDLAGTPYCTDFEWTDADVGSRQRLFDLDRRMIGEARRVFTIGAVPTARLEKYNGLRAPALHPPPRLSGRLRRGPYGDYFLSVGRLETLKRVDLAIRALARSRTPARLVVVGDGTQREALGRVAEESDVADRVEFAGSVTDEALVDLYAGARAVVFAPFDEDYGYVTLEAFLSGKPVVTARDSGGTLEFVEDGVNGFVCEPSPEGIGAALARLAADPGRAAALGDAGYDRGRLVTWDGVVEKLVGASQDDRSASGLA
jgi:glycosyltransferase involved in cell wall biosynthesis